MIRVVVAPEARDDLRQIWRYLARKPASLLQTGFVKSCSPRSPCSRGIPELVTSAKT